ncbi:hypothetical protein [Dendronalium phyllosphericum]|nr:hypothetical protein [Dendronalium phyllosphericum]
MKRIVIGTLLALPLALASFPSHASAAEIVVRPVVRHRVVHHPIVRRQVVRQRLIPGHWEHTRNGRRWVAARYVRY